MDPKYSAIKELHCISIREKHQQNMLLTCHSLYTDGLFHLVWDDSLYM